MKKLCLYAVLLVGLLGGAAWAQIPVSMQNDTILDSYYPEHQPLPAEIRQLLDANKAKEAVAEYGKIKKNMKADPMDIYLWDLEVYGTASVIDPSNPTYGKMREDVLKKMLEEYPKNVEVLMYTMPADGNIDKTLEVLDKIIEVDPEYLPAYEQRFNAYKERKMIKEACMDYMKLPESTQRRLNTEGVDCKALVEETENK